MPGWLLLIAVLAFFIYYGFHLVVKRGKGGPDADALVTPCHLCRHKYPVREMVAREKEAGFVNYFCGECIEKLSADYATMQRR